MLNFNNSKFMFSFRPFLYFLIYLIVYNHNGIQIRIVERLIFNFNKNRNHFCTYEMLSIFFSICSSLFANEWSSFILSNYKSWLIILIMLEYLFLLSSPIFCIKCVNASHEQQFCFYWLQILSLKVYLLYDLYFWTFWLRLTIFLNLLKISRKFFFTSNNMIIYRLI